MKVAVQMDPIETINIVGDSTFALMLEGQRRGHRLFYYQPAALRCAMVISLLKAAMSRCVTSAAAMPSSASCGASSWPSSMWC